MIRCELEEDLRDFGSTGPFAVARDLILGVWGRGDLAVFRRLDAFHEFSRMNTSKVFDLAFWDCTRK